MSVHAAPVAPCRSCGIMKPIDDRSSNRYCGRCIAVAQMIDKAESSGELEEIRVNFLSGFDPDSLLRTKIDRRWAELRAQEVADRLMGKRPDNPLW